MGNISNEVNAWRGKPKPYFCEYETGKGSNLRYGYTLTVWGIDIGKIYKYGKDYCFLRETDRIFSLLRNQKHNFVLGDIQHLRGKDDEFAMSIQKDHIKYKKLAIQRALELNQ